MPLCPVETFPTLGDSVCPPLVLGTGELTHAAMQGMDGAGLAHLIDEGTAHPAARLLDSAVVQQFSRQRIHALALQATALDISPLFRIRRGPEPTSLRLLALLLPGDLMMNAPLDCITNHLDVRLDLLYLRPGAALPDTIPDHDVMIVAASEAEPPMLNRLARLFNIWPRPALNDPRLLPLLSRDKLSQLLAGIPGLCSPPATVVTRDDLLRLHSGAVLLDRLLPGATWPVLLRPAGSHAGAGLERVDDQAGLERYLIESLDDTHTLTGFVDYRSADGFYRKWRVSFIDRAPYLCHMAVSDHWMVHYLNAGMTGSAEKRNEEAQAMDGFQAGFARRHRDAFAAMHERLPLDYYQIDCGELPDGRLIVFEADTAAIIHMMDPPDLFPYKQIHMQKAFDAFRAMLAQRAGAQA